MVPELSSGSDGQTDQPVKGRRRTALGADQWLEEGPSSAQAPPRVSGVARRTSDTLTLIGS